MNTRYNSRMELSPSQNEHNSNDEPKTTNGRTKPDSADFRFTTYFLEDHEDKIFAIEFCNHLKEGQPIIFATCGSNRVTIYECHNDPKIKLLQCYSDPDINEKYYTCCWSSDPRTSHTILAVGGFNRIIRIINPITMTCSTHFIGHGEAIHELKFHPKEPSILASASKDHSVRLWNVQTEVCIAIFGGIEGHQSEVLSVDFDVMGNRIASCGMDHSIKLWRLDRSYVKEAIKASFTYNRNESNHPFKTVAEHFPEFSTLDIHDNYVDCVKWMGNLLLSKACHSAIVCWKPGRLGETDETLSMTDSYASVITRFNYVAGDLFYIRFSVNANMGYMAVGNDEGTITVWKINGDTPTKPIYLKHFLCRVTIRSTAFSRDGQILICGCDDGRVYRWDRIDS